MRRLEAVLGVALMVGVSGCVIAQAPVNGSIYTNAKGPVSVGHGTGMKIGRTCAQGVLGFGWGDASIEAAKAAGNITEIAQVDYETTSVLGVWGRFCTVAKGN